MIAVITSSLVPAGHSFFSNEKRFAQTLYTVECLYNAGFRDIYLFDNSVEDVDELFSSFPGVKCYHSRQYNFYNKGLNEALLILNNIRYLPQNTPIFKISGRYYPNENFRIIEPGLLKKYEFIGKGVDFTKHTPAFMTRSYFVRDSTVIEENLVLAVEEMLGYSRGIYGIKSLLKVLSTLTKPTIGSSFQLSIEQALGRILKKNKNYHLLEKINTDGYMAGVSELEFIQD